MDHLSLICMLFVAGVCINSVIGNFATLTMIIVLARIIVLVDFIIGNKAII